MQIDRHTYVTQQGLSFLENKTFFCFVLEQLVSLQPEIKTDDYEWTIISKGIRMPPLRLSQNKRLNTGRFG